MTKHDVKEFRKKTGWTQTQLAQEMGITRITVSNWERGRTAVTGLYLKTLKELQKKTCLCENTSRQQ